MKNWTYLDAVGRPILAAAGLSGRLDPLKAGPRAGRPAPQHTRPTNHRFFNRAVLAALALLPAAAFAQPLTYDDTVRPVFARRCFTCHGNGESRNGLSLETFAGVMKGGASGDAVQPGRPATSLLYQAVAQEKDGIVRMPLGQPRLPDTEI